LRRRSGITGGGGNTRMSVCMRRSMRLPRLVCGFKSMLSTWIGDKHIVRISCTGTHTSVCRTAITIVIATATATATPTGVVPRAVTVTTSAAWGGGTRAWGGTTIRRPLTEHLHGIIFTRWRRRVGHTLTSHAALSPTPAYKLLNGVLSELSELSVVVTDTCRSR
jgi:hypothetical protein